MTIERTIFAFAGAVIMISVALAHWVSPMWLFLTAFVGLNLFQSAFTGFCPLAILLKKFGVPAEKAFH